MKIVCDMPIGYVWAVIKDNLSEMHSAHSGSWHSTLCYSWNLYLAARTSNCNWTDSIYSSHVSFQCTGHYTLINSTPLPRFLGRDLLTGLRLYFEGQTVLSIRFEVDICQYKSRRLRLYRWPPLLGVSVGMLPQKILKSKLSEIRFPAFWAW